MPLYMDTHRLGRRVSVEDVARAHMADLREQGMHDVTHLRYWVAEHHGVIFCLAEAPSADAAVAVHRQAHGLLADEVYQVQEGS